MKPVKKKSGSRHTVLARPPLSIPETAVALNCSAATIHRYCKAGLLPFVMIAGQIRIDAAAVARAQREGIGS